MTPPAFKDHFSAAAAEYAAFRPTYPAALFDFVATLPERRRAAWDCATGNGQAAVPLAAYFDRVVGTDASAEQIVHATPHARVAYHVALSDASGLESDSMDLVTVAQALHWLPHERFFAEVRRVLAPGGALAVWCYTMAVITPPIDEVVTRYYAVTCGPYWSPERALVDEGYRSIELPIDEVAAPPLAIEASLTLAQFGGYMRTWSATRKLAAATGEDPVVAIEAELGPLWGESGATRLVRWPIRVRAGRLRVES